MNLRFLEQAEQELHESFIRYEAEESGLGHRFVAEINQSITRIVDFPKAYQLLNASTRRCLVAGSPYGLYYHLDEATAEILVIAVGHLHREPEFWSVR